MNDLERFKKVLTCDTATGKLTWIVSRGSAGAGRIAGAIGPRGYRRISISGHHYWTHRLVWLFATGQWPRGEIDHINHDKGDNSIVNLRDVAHCVNDRNLIKGRSLPCGIEKIRNKYRARVWSGGSHCSSRAMPTVTFALLWLAVLRAKHDGSSR